MIIHSIKTKYLLVLISVMTMAFLLSGCSTKKDPVKVVILPHFEIGEMAGDERGEAQDYYEKYLMGTEPIKLKNGDVVYYNKQNGILMCITGEGKTESASNMSCLLADERFDFSNAYLVATGCAGGNTGVVTLGDVSIQTAAVDYDLGYIADVRDFKNNDPQSVWFHEIEFDNSSCFLFNEELIEKAYEITKEIKPQTTEIARDTMQNNFPGEEWANRDPKVLKGTSVTGDQYWKGSFSNQKANYITDYYDCPDPYTACEMEDVAMAYVAKEYGMLDRLIAIRGIVDMDVFLNGHDPESLWGENDGISASELFLEENEETLDVFDPCMESTAQVGIAIIDAILDGRLTK